MRDIPSVAPPRMIFQLNDLPGYTDFTTLFAEYKVLEIEATFVPCFNTYNSNTYVPHREWWGRRACVRCFIWQRMLMGFRTTTLSLSSFNMPRIESRP